MTDEQLLSRPIVILGAPRSGTTLLSNILGKHTDVAHLIEPRMTWRFGNDRKSDLLKPEHATPQVIAHIRRKFAHFVREQGKTRLVEKTPSNSIRPAFVQKVFPDAIFIHIIRNGYDACLANEDFWDKHASGLSNVAKGRLSMRLKELGPLRLPFYAREFASRIAPKPIKPIFGPSLWGPRLPGMSDMARELDPIAVSCLQWRTCVEISCHFGRSLPRENYFEFKLEDVSRSLIEQILERCQLEPDPAVQDYLEKSFDSKRAGARSKDADAEQIRAAKPWIESTNHWLGYADNG